MKNYKSMQEIIDIYKIPQQTVNMILKKYKIDTFKNKKWLQIYFRDFYKIYTSAYNPSLFVFSREKKMPSAQISGEDLFVQVFSQPYRIK